MSNGLEMHELDAFEDAAFDAWHHVDEVAEVQELGAVATPWRRPQDRGHRLGVAVKVANLRLLQRERPDIVRLTTYIAEVNAHMIGVNEAMGFVPSSGRVTSRRRSAS